MKRGTTNIIAKVGAEMRVERGEANPDHVELFAIIDGMREAFDDVPAEEIERIAVAIVRQLREADEAAIGKAEQATIERRPA